MNLRVRKHTTGKTMIIYVIVRNTLAQPEGDKAEIGPKNVSEKYCIFDTLVPYEEIQPQFGWFYDAAKVEERVNSLNRDWRKEFADGELLDSKYDSVSDAQRDELFKLAEDDNLYPLIDLFIELGYDAGEDLETRLQLFGFIPIEEAYDVEDLRTHQLP
jgi:hypothetical protein